MDGKLTPPARDRLDSSPKNEPTSPDDSSSTLTDATPYADEDSESSADKVVRLSGRASGSLSKVPPEPQYNRGSRRPTALSVITLAVALAAAAMAGWTMLHANPNTPPQSAGPASSGPPASPPISEAERLKAKTKICAAANTVGQGITLNTNREIPGGPDDAVGVLAVAANARLSLLAGGQYLLTQVDPAVPADLADAVHQFSTALMDFGATATAGIPNSDPLQNERLHTIDGLNTTVHQLCG